MKVETIVLLFNGCAFLINTAYHIVRLYYERKKIRLMELERGP